MLRLKKVAAPVNIIVDAHIEKRPLHHPAIPSPHSSDPKVVYISAKTPFVSTIKRVRKQLELIDKRAMGNVSLLGPGGDKKKIMATGKQEGRNEAVTLKATGKAIERAIDLGLYFQEQDDLKIRIETGTLTVVDDIVENEGPDAEEGLAPSGDLPETQIRSLPVLEVAVSFR